MAGQKRPQQLQQLLRNMFWFVSLFRVLMNVSAQTESSVLTVADSNWTLILEGEWMLKFYAPWCPACQHIQNDWEAFAKQSPSLGISVGNVDVTQQPGRKREMTMKYYASAIHIKAMTMNCVKPDLLGKIIQI